MNAFLPPSDPERELDELRRRAYGRNPDIQVDPSALARLMELESARPARPTDGADAEIGEPAADTAGVPRAGAASTASASDRPDPAAGVEPAVAPGEESPRSLWHRLATTSARRGWLVAGALVAVLVVATTAASLLGPHPEATLRPIESEPDPLVLSLLIFRGADIDRSSIRRFESWRGFEPWFAVEKQGAQCFLIIERSRQMVDGAKCAPPGVDLFAEYGSWPFFGSDRIDDLPEGSLIRFHYRGDSVDVYVYPASGAD
ncbi:MAG: hypothetical protein ABWY23_07685 [Mycetocola sp.]